MITLAEAGQGIAIVPSTVQFVSKKIQIMPLVQDRKSLGVWGGLAWDPRRAQPGYAATFVDDITTYVARAAPGKRFDRIAPPLPDFVRRA